jgi:hypothetical protein
MRLYVNICIFIQMQTMDESHIEAQQMSQDEDHESESVRSDATTEENDDDEGM